MPKDDCILGYRVRERTTRADCRLLRRLWSEEHGEPWPEGMFACHSCDEPRCSNVHHIFPGTNSDNLRDAVAKGRLLGMNSGESHGASKLTADDVLVIKQLAGTLQQKRIAERFGIRQSTVSRILNGKRWATYPRGGELAAESRGLRTG